MTRSISVVINTWNEEKNLAWALRSVRSWTDQIVVVDMHSKDRTREIAAEYGAEVYLHEWLGFADPARSFAIQKAHGDFILILDADELIPEPLSRQLRAMTTDDRYDVARIARVNYLLGSPLEHTGWGADKDRHLRFFRRGSLETTSTIHDFLKPVHGARICELAAEPELSIVHFNYLDVSHFIDKLNRYTSIEAQQAHARGETPSALVSALKAGAEFFRRFVKGEGYRDGWRGFYLSALMAFYRLSAAAKLAELAAGLGANAAQDIYAQTAERLLQEYPRGAQPSAAGDDGAGSAQP
jgi:glycosyltransferase involved in cell wall biosynthesis